MTWGTCYNASNNIYFDYPPIMNDARMYKEEKVVDDYILKELKINNNHHYRQFLQQNADTIIVKNQANYHGNKKYSNNNEEYILGNYYQKGSSHGYLNSDLKNLYISRLQMNNYLNMPRINLN